MSATPLAKLNDAVLEYDRHVALEVDGLTIPAGVGVVAVIGPNGSGKSTLLHALSGLLSPRAGSVEVLGVHPLAARSRVSYVLQTHRTEAFLPITVREVVRMGRYPRVGWWRRFRAEDHEAVRWAMDRLNITDLADRQVHELSGGQRQRVHIAQGIAQPHRILLLDEPLTGLDLGSARTIDELIHDERGRGGAVILTTHDLDEARAADFVIVVNGRVMAAGAPGSTLSRSVLEDAFGLGALHDGPGFWDDHTHG